MKFHQGKFNPKFPQKYNGNVNTIKYRSSWELQVFVYMDKNPDVVSWNSEEVIVPYVSPIDGRKHRYIVDIWMKNRKGGVYLIEIKPAAQSQPPKKKSRVTKKYLNEVKTWGVNQAKWVAATAYCQERGWTFKVITEKDLFKYK